MNPYPLRLNHTHIKFLNDTMVCRLNPHGNYFSRFQRIDNTINPQPRSGIVWTQLFIIAICYFLQQIILPLPLKFLSLVI